MVYQYFRLRCFLLLTIQNEHITLKVDTLGAQMMELWSSDGVQNLWQGDPSIYRTRANV